MEISQRKLRLLTRKQLLFRRFMTGPLPSGSIKVRAQLAFRLRRLLRIELDLADLELRESKSE